MPHPHTVTHNLLIHRRGHSNLPRLLNTHCPYNNCHVYSSSIHNDPHARPHHRNTHVHHHSPRKRNLIDRRRNTSVCSSDSTICCAGASSSSGHSGLHYNTSNTPKRIDYSGHIHTFPCPHRRRNTSYNINYNSSCFLSCRQRHVGSVGRGRCGFERCRRPQHTCYRCWLYS